MKRYVMAFVLMHSCYAAHAMLGELKNQYTRRAHDTKETKSDKEILNNLLVNYDTSSIFSTKKELYRLSVPSIGWSQITKKSKL